MDRQPPDVKELLASRARLVSSADEERRGLERALHDGVQQQLVAIAVELQLALQLQRKNPAAAAASLEQVRRSLLLAVAEPPRVCRTALSAPARRSGTRRGSHCGSGARRRTGARRVAADHSERAEVALTVYLCCVRALAGSKCSSLVARREDDVLRFEVVAADERVVAEVASSLTDRVHALGGQLVSEGSRITGSLPVAPVNVMSAPFGEIEDHRLNPLVDCRLPGEPELEEDRVDDLLDRPLREHERLRRSPALFLPSAISRRTSRSRGVSWESGDCLVPRLLRHECLDHLGVDHRPALGHGADGRDELLDVLHPLLQQIRAARGPALEECERIARAPRTG